MGPTMNKIDTITLHGFKSIRELVAFPLGNLNLIVGANGAGKSNFIQVFRLVRAMLLKGFQDYVARHGGASSFLFGGPKTTESVQAEFVFGDNSYRFTLRPTVDDKFSITEEHRYLDNNWRVFSRGELESRLVDEKDDESSMRPGVPGVGHYVYAAISRWMIYHFHDTGDFAPMRGSSIVEDNERLREDAANIAPFLRRLQRGVLFEQNCYARILDATRLVAPFFDGFLLDSFQSGPAEKVKLAWRQKGSDYPFQPYHLSDGTLRFICLATALLQPHPPSTIVIDEPELGLHPQAVDILAELLKIASARTQVIVATQSPQLLDSFDVEDIIVASRKNGETSLGRLDSRDYAAWLKDYSPGTLWASNVIEGGPVHE